MSTAWTTHVDMSVQYVEIADVVRTLRVTKTTVGNWIRLGRLPAIRAGRRVLIHPEALQEFIRSSNQPQPQPQS